ncbi:uncharacterized protein V1513DRAFT_377570, partial [Lipomyces chichibuensis]|uniref:uncharacterized protein n=1 Tax=Lipomyces chichibuensis TaxID=1546026 RepID=UPI003343AA2C
AKYISLHVRKSSRATFYLFRDTLTIACLKSHEGSSRLKNFDLEIEEEVDVYLIEAIKSLKLSGAVVPY